MLTLFIRWFLICLFDTQEALDDEYIENSDDNMDQDPLGDPLDIAEQGLFSSIM